MNEEDFDGGNGGSFLKVPVQRDENDFGSTCQNLFQCKRSDPFLNFRLNSFHTKMPVQCFFGRGQGTGKGLVKIIDGEHVNKNALRGLLKR